MAVSCYAECMSPLSELAVGTARVAQPWRVRAEQSGDLEAIEKLVDLTFGPGRFAKSAYRLREGVLPDARLSFVAQDSESASLWGSVRFWPVAAGETAALLLGPLAVVPQLRGRGIGISLMKHAIQAASALEYPAILLVGDEPYYAKVGFARLRPGQVQFPGPVDPNRVLGLALNGSSLTALSGTVKRARIDCAVSANAAGVAADYLYSNG
jgi:predicted N-acetyltransferase YhbS